MHRMVTPQFSEVGGSRREQSPLFVPIEGKVRMVSMEYTPKRPAWVRDIVIGVTAGLGTNLVWALVKAAARLLG